MGTCLCPAALACATRALVGGDDPLVLDCDHSVDEDELLCACCNIGMCGAQRYVDEEGVLIYEHVSVQPHVRWVHLITPLGVFQVGLN